MLIFEPTESSGPPLLPAEIASIWSLGPEQVQLYGHAHCLLGETCAPAVISFKMSGAIICMMFPL